MKILNSMVRLLTYSAVICATLGTVMFVEQGQLRTRQAEQKAETNAIVDQLARNLATALTRKTVAAAGIAQTVSLLPEISQDQFARISNSVASDDSSIVGISLIHDRRISHVYPLEEKKNLLGSDLRKTVGRVDAVNQVRRSGVGAIQGPIQLLVGVDGFVVRQPVFLPRVDPDGETRNDSTDFWGLVSLVFAAKPFFDDVGVFSLSQEHDIAFRSLSDDAVTPVFGDLGLFALDSAKREVVLPLGAWEIAVSPSSGWMSKLPNAWPLRAVATAATIILLMLLRDFLNLRESQKRDGQRLKVAIDAMPDGFVLYDENDRLVICNEKYKEFYPKSAAAMKPGKSFRSILEFGLANGQYVEAVGREQDWLADRLERHLSDEAFVEQELDDGRWLRIIEREAPDGSRAGLRVDVTELKKNEKKLEVLLNRNPAIVMSQGRNWTIQTCSDAWTRQFGYSREETVGRDLTDFMPSEDAAKSKAFREKDLLSEDAPSIVKNILKIMTKAGETRYVELQSIVDTEGDEWLNLIAMTDITPIIYARKELERLVENDELTGLMSRRGLQRRHKDGRRKRDVGFFLIDLDYFKSVNDGYGHEAGDDLLKAVACTLKRLTAVTGCPIRLGGEEFAVVRRWSGWQEAGEYAEALRQALEQTSIVFQGKLLHRTASIGYIDVKTEDELSTAMHLADLAQREAKSSGRNTCLPANANMLRKLEDQGAFVTNDQIQTALEAGDFFYEVQPIVHAGNGQITGFEALMRWRMQDGEVVKPNRFIERLYEVLRQPYFGMLRDRLRADLVYELSGLGGRYVGFNFILEEIAYPGAAERIRSSFEQALKLSELRILIEISERAFHSRVDTGILVDELHKLRSYGFLIALDDFGVASSNIQRLQQFPIDIVKLDRSLILDITESDRQRTTVRSISRMIENLGLSCIIEGVETEQQAQVLQKMGLNVQQGFFHAVPSSPARIAVAWSNNGWSKVQSEDRLREKTIHRRIEESKANTLRAGRKARPVAR